MASKYRVAHIYPNGSLGVVRAGGGPTNVTVRTWADGFGNWHAEFRPTGNAHWDARIAREAINYELAARSGLSDGYRFAFRTTRKAPGHYQESE